MDELASRTGQVAALMEQLPPEPLSRGLEGERAKRVAHLAQQQGQMRLETPPVTPDEFTPTRYL